MRSRSEGRPRQSTRGVDGEGSGQSGQRGGEAQLILNVQIPVQHRQQLQNAAGGQQHIYVDRTGQGRKKTGSVRREQ